MRFNLMKYVAAGFLAAISAGGADAADNELYIYNWSNYFPPDLVTVFEKETGIKITIDTFDSNDTLLAKIQANPSSYDVILPSDYMVPIMAKQGLLLEIDGSKFENFKNVNPTFRAPTFDPERKYTVPYMYGTTGIAYDQDAVKGAKLEESWKEFFEPRPEFQGKIGSLSDSDSVWSAAAYYLGIDRCTVDKADGKKILDLLEKQKPYVKVFSTQGTIDRMIAGEVSMHLMYNGAAHRVAQQRKSVVYLVPKEGLDQWADAVAIPAKAPHVENAKKFLNWIMDPKIAAQISNFTGFMNTLDGTDKYMDKALLDDPAINLPKDQLDRLRQSVSCDEQNRALRTKVWTQLMK